MAANRAVGVGDGLSRAAFAPSSAVVCVAMEGSFDRATEATRARARPRASHGSNNNRANFMIEGRVDFRFVAQDGQDRKRLCSLGSCLLSLSPHDEKEKE